MVLSSIPPSSISLLPLRIFLDHTSNAYALRMFYEVRTRYVEITSVKNVHPLSNTHMYHERNEYTVLAIRSFKLQTWSESALFAH